MEESTKYEEIRELVRYDGCYESDLFMPNEMFDELRLHIKNTPHIAFAYTYIYFVTWLYRYTKHFIATEAIDNTKIKEVLGYDKNNRTVNYLIKKNGLLDQLEYLTSTREFPVAWNFSDLEEEPLEFVMLSDLDEYESYLPNVSNRFFIKYPNKAFQRIFKAGEMDYHVEGTFYDIDDTHNVPFEVFLYCMSNNTIGCTGFYLYAYLKHKNDIYVNGYDVSLVNLSLETGIAESTLDKYLGLLKSYELISFNHNQAFFAVGLAEDDKKANTYFVNEYPTFSEKPLPFDKIQILKREDYDQKLQKNEMWGQTVAKRIEIRVEDLPF